MHVSGPNSLLSKGVGFKTKESYNLPFSSLNVFPSQIADVELGTLSNIPFSAWLEIQYEWYPTSLKISTMLGYSYHLFFSWFFNLLEFSMYLNALVVLVAGASTLENIKSPPHEQVS